MVRDPVLKGESMSDYSEREKWPRWMSARARRIFAEAMNLAEAEVEFNRGASDVRLVRLRELARAIGIQERWAVSQAADAAYKMLKGDA